jgi:hypothetical protein
MVDEPNVANAAIFIPKNEEMQNLYTFIRSNNCAKKPLSSESF